MRACRHGIIGMRRTDGSCLCICDKCRAERRAANRIAQRKYYETGRGKTVSKAWTTANKDKRVDSARSQKLKKMNRTPAWADMTAIRVFYREARRLTRDTGILHHVDHVVPLLGEFVCGLHVENNLAILTANANIAKGNSWEGT